MRRKHGPCRDEGPRADWSQEAGVEGIRASASRKDEKANPSVAVGESGAPPGFPAVTSSRLQHFSKSLRRIRPHAALAADDVASALAEVAVAPPANAIFELAGPESMSVAAFVGKAPAANGPTRFGPDEGSRALTRQCTRAYSRRQARLGDGSEDAGGSA
jgi:hypothetical protein